MATRILITCKSHQVPGADEDKATLLTNEACQMVLDRDFNETLGDRLTIEGEFSYGVRCSLLVDNGPVDSTDYTTSFFKWDGEKLVPYPLPPHILRKLEERFQFNPANRPQRICYTDEEYRKTFGPKKYEQLVKGRVERRDIAKRFDRDWRQPQANDLGFSEG